VNEGMSVKYKRNDFRYGLERVFKFLFLTAQGFIGTVANWLPGCLF